MAGLARGAAGGGCLISQGIFIGHGWREKTAINYQAFVSIYSGSYSIRGLISPRQRLIKVPLRWPEIAGIVPPAARCCTLCTPQLQIIFWSKPIFRTVLMITSCILTTTTATLLVVTTQTHICNIGQCMYRASHRTIPVSNWYTGNWLLLSINNSAFLSIYQDSFEHLFLTSVLK